MTCVADAIRRIYPLSELVVDVLKVQSSLIWLLLGLSSIFLKKINILFKSDLSSGLYTLACMRFPIPPHPHASRIALSRKTSSLCSIILANAV